MWVLLLEVISPAVNILVFTTGWIGGLSDFAGQANSSDPGSFVFTVFFYLGILLFFIQAAIGWLNIKKEILFLNQSSSPLAATPGPFHLISFWIFGFLAGQLIDLTQYRVESVPQPVAQEVQ